jgi:general secretion pathway protein G
VITRPLAASGTYAIAIRAGRRRPHSTRWVTLAKLVDLVLGRAPNRAIKIAYFTFHPCRSTVKAQHFAIRPQQKAKPESGLTLLELIVATSILLVLSTMALPLARLTIQRQRERQLRIDLWEMRDAIDRYKEMADRGAFQTKVDSQGYPPDLDTLVKGIDIQGKKIRFLRRIPIDPMTGTDWGLRSMQDDPDSDSWGEQNVFDVYTKSEGTALDGTKYKDW